MTCTDTNEDVCTYVTCTLTYLTYFIYHLFQLFDCLLWEGASDMIHSEVSQLQA